MIQKITDNWYMLKYECDGDRLVWFGHDETVVLHKFTAWFRQNRETKIWL